MAKLCSSGLALLMRSSTMFFSSALAMLQVGWYWEKARLE